MGERDIGEEGGESEMIKEEEEEESGETSMTETAGGELIPRRDKPAKGEVEETEIGYAEAMEARPAKGEVEETEEGYAKAKEEAEEKKGDGGTCPCLQEEARWADNGWVTWKQHPESGKWSEEQVRAEHARDKKDRVKNWWGGTDLDREPDTAATGEKVYKYMCPRGTRAGFGNRMAEWPRDRWTQQFVIARNWKTHWKYKNWEKTALRPSWRTEAQWETSEAWNNKKR